MQPTFSTSQPEYIQLGPAAPITTAANRPLPQCHWTVCRDAYTIFDAAKGQDQMGEDEPMGYRAEGPRQGIFAGLRLAAATAVTQLGGRI